MAEVRLLIPESSELASSDWDICNTVIYDPTFMRPVNDGELNEELGDQCMQSLLKFA